MIKRIRVRRSVSTMKAAFPSVEGFADIRAKICRRLNRRCFRRPQLLTRRTRRRLRICQPRRVRRTPKKQKMLKTKRSGNYLFLLGLAAAAFVVWSAEAADVILNLRNGDRLSGAIVSETPTEITIKSKALGK